MGLIVTGDLQLSDNPRDQYRHVWMDSFIKLVEQRKPKAVIILGDLTEEKDRHSAVLVNDVVSYMHALAEVCPVVGLQGNHDYVADPDNGFWPFLNRVHNVTWIHRPTNFNKWGYQLMLLPHTRNYMRDWANIDLTGHDWIFCHNTFEGTDAGRGHKLEGIPLSFFPTGARVVSGDVHTPQTIGPVTYAGSPYLCDFGDDYRPRILLLDQNSMKSMPCPGAQKRLVEIRSIEDLVLQKHVQKGDLVKVRMALRMEDRDKWPEIQSTIRYWAEKRGVAIDSIAPQFKMIAGQRTRMTPKRSDAETMKAYAAARGVTGPILDTGLELIED